MSELGIEALLERLRDAPSGTSIQDLLSSFRAPEPVALLEARKRCALVRWFDQDIYSFLCADLAGNPDFDALTEAPFVQRLAPAKWTIAAAERARLLAEWQSDTVSWRDWNTRIGRFFEDRQGMEDQLSAVYHLAASTSPESVEVPFRTWFSDADGRFDMAHCNALLEMLRVQESWRGAAVSSLWREYREYHTARVLFADDYFKTGSYFQRPDVHSKFVSVLERSATHDPWVFHIHASGGIGKSMYTRWLMARYLVPYRIPCARVDLDDYLLQEVVNFPIKVIVRIVEQWSKQSKGGGLSSLLEKLVREVAVPGWNRSIMQEIKSQLKGSGIGSSIVVVLDTLEEATLCADDWLSPCVNFLREIRSSLPGLTLVLSGRYDITERSRVLVSGESLSYELPRFSEKEAHDYLESRSIPAGSVRDAIVARAEADETSPGSTEKMVGRNPFKLAMFAELALNRQKLTAEEVLRFPRADIAYLIERVIKRIESQPLRWIIRYGAIARHLTPEFAQEVLLPPLLRALRGTNNDQPDSGLVELNDDYKDVWLPDSKAARELEEKGISPLWDRLSTYARDRGWLSWVDSEHKTELRFHPEVLNPTRDLLRHQEIFNELQRRSAQFFEDKALAMAQKQPPEIEACARFSCEAVFHRFQLEGVGAETFWINTLRRVEKLGSYIAVQVATEITGRDYAEAESIPYPRVSSTALLLRAHCEAADLLLQSDIADRKHWVEFRRHIDLARRIAGKNAYLGATIPPLLRTVYLAGLRETAEKKEVVDVLKDAMLYAQEPRDSFFLNWELGKFLVLQGLPEAAIYLRKALPLLLEAERTSTSFVDIHLKLVDLYAYQGIHTAVIEALRAARKSTTRGNRIRVMQPEASYFLKVGDTGSAEKRLAEIKELAQPSGSPNPAADVLEARIAIARLDPLAALRAATRPQAPDLPAKDRARFLDQQGEAHALLFEFETALNLWNLASSSYDQARDPVGSARCSLLSASLVAKVIGDFGTAETHVLSALSLRGSHDTEIQSELQLLYALIELRMNRVSQAVERVRNLCCGEDLPDRIRARTLIFALIFGLDHGDELLSNIEESISEIQPVSLRDSMLDWAEYCEQSVTVTPEFVARLMELLTRPAFESSRGTGILIQRADLYRVFGMPKEAEAELARVADSDPLLGWRLSSARDRLGLPANYGSLLERFLSSEFAPTPICTVVHIAAAWEAVGNNDFLEAQRLMGPNPPQPTGLPVKWQGRLAQTLTRLATSIATPFVARSPLKFKPAPAAATPAPIPEECLVLTENDVPVEWRIAANSTDLAVDMFFGGMGGGWQQFAKAMHSVLLEKYALGKPLEFISGMNALPWELAGAYCRRSSKANSATFPAGFASSPGSVLLVLPEDTASEISSTSDSGFAIEQVYRGFGFSPTTMSSFGNFPSVMSLGPPVVIHIGAAVREASSGIYLDFSTSEYRAASIGQAWTQFEISLTAFRLDQILSSLPVHPFIILDPGLPFNSTEAVRMLLLRNLFATQLFELGHVRGIFGCGLAKPYDRYLITSRCVEYLRNRSVIGVLEGLRSEIPDFPQNLDLLVSQDLDFVLPRFCAALWSNSPQDHLFAP